MADELSFEDIIGNVEEILGQIESFLDDNPAVRTLVLTAFAKIQQWLREAGEPTKPKRPLTADDLKAMVKTTVEDLRDSQSTWEQFLELSIDTSEDAVKLLALLLGLELD